MTHAQLNSSIVARVVADSKYIVHQDLQCSSIRRINTDLHGKINKNERIRVSLPIPIK